MHTHHGRKDNDELGSLGGTTRMANGKGTISCSYCKHHAALPVERCNLYHTDFPLDALGHDNPICPDFTETQESSPQFGMQRQLSELLPRMRHGYLYGFPYPSHNRLADLREVAKLTPYV